MIMIKIIIIAVKLLATFPKNQTMLNILTKKKQVNSEQHFYIETLEDGKREIEFLVETSKSSDYKWGLWVTQIFCDGTRTIQAPTGCFQYHFDTSGLMKSFNYEGGQYLNNQHYRICILASSDACQIEYTSEGEFMLEKWGNYKTVPYTRAGATSTYCVQDYLSIPGASNSTSTPSSDRFCGGQLNSQHGARSSQPLVSRVRSRLATLELHTGEKFLVQIWENIASRNTCRKVLPRAP